MAGVSVSVQLGRLTKVYRDGDLLCGVVCLSAPGPLRHEGVTLTVSGSVQLTLSGKTAGVVDAFYATPKSLRLLHEELPLAAAGRLPAGVTEVPFEVSLAARHGRPLYETYHGLYLSVQYTVVCALRRGVLAKDVTGQMEFIVEAAADSMLAAETRPLSFLMEPLAGGGGGDGGVTAPMAAVTGARHGYRLRGRFESTECIVTQPLRGDLTLERCDAPVRSLELQLVRSEACGRAEAPSRQSSEVQNIQLGLGDVPRGLAIPVHMVFPRLFTCASVSAAHFQIDFSVNVVLVLTDDHVVSENFPLKLTRY